MKPSLRHVFQRVCQTVEREIAANRHRLKDWAKELFARDPLGEPNSVDVAFGSDINIIIGDGVTMRVMEANQCKTSPEYYHVPVDPGGFLIGFLFVGGIESGDELMFGCLGNACGGGAQHNSLHHLDDIIVNNTDEFHRVFADGFYWPLNCTRYHWPGFKLNRKRGNDSPAKIWCLYAQETSVASNTYLFSMLEHIIWEFTCSNAKVFQMHSGMICSFFSRPGKRRSLNYPYVHHGTKIARAIRTYIRRKKWRVQINQVHSELRAFPGVGVDYFAAVKRFTRAVIKN